jgi:uncharacterized delta-60 repeat protein
VNRDSRRRHKGRLAATAVFLVLALASTALAAAGDLDTSFSQDGKKTTNIQGVDRAEDVLVLPSGKILVAGSASSFANFALVRYRPNGGLDRTFSEDGRKQTDLGGADSVAAMARQDDGKIVLVGTTNQTGDDIGLARYNPRGGLDESFGGDGKVVTDLGEDEVGRDVSILPNGKILVAGQSIFGTEADFLVARYNPNGKLDTNSDSNPSSHFSQNGWRTIDFPAADEGGDYAQAMAVRDGKITVAGFTYTIDMTTDFALARLRTRGGLDDTFDDDGRTTVDFEDNYDQANDIKVLPNGKTIAVGEVEYGGLARFGFARLNENGTKDAGFGGDGERAIALNGGTESGEGQALEVQADGKYVGVGRSIANDRFALVRVRKNGNRDDSFGDSGEVETTIGSSSSGRGSVLDATGRIIAVGQATVVGNDNFEIARYLSQ